ncbi:mitochondrial coenzyme A diphosphatase NUDT8 isoform X2 [Mastacembelus armatus]|uniref:mitochondrial coenzyme A diphosphatase NUDT8 isoform X2 n=1 Tax=Mastacembelus armatus TaxID=205130 RepID=UPI000E463A2D|nr:nucleoside diphosphate-linked moiety X motif 8 isoform X2 [Mastacembelus armatus]
MFRGHQILAGSCPIRSLLLLRESHLSALSEHTGAVWQGAGHGKGRRYEGIPGRGRSNQDSWSSTETEACSSGLSLSRFDCENNMRAEASFPNLVSKAILSSHHQPPQISASVKSKQASDSWKCTIVDDLGQKPKAVNTYCDCLTNTTCTQPWRRPWDFCQHSLIVSKTRCSLLHSCLSYRRHSVRPFSMSTHTTWILNRFHCRPQAFSFSVRHIKAIHQATPRVHHAWKDCLSPENENRCRQNLGPNLKLYEVEKGTKGASQGRGKNQSAWASVLVSLCSVEEEPAFLFTLRSCRLKGIHKGDVSFAGGKGDPSDRDVVATALREAKEELGINVAAENVWGVLKPLRDRVEEIFTLSLTHLCNPQNRGYTHFRTGDTYGYTLPVFRNGKHRVWGLTAVALDHTLKLIIPS